MAFLRVLVMLMLCWTAKAINTCPNGCLKCTATDVQCEGIDFITELSWVRNTTTSLQMKDCRINNLTNDSFKDLPKLTFIDLSKQRGGLKIQDGNVFQNLNELTHVLLGGNVLKSLPNDTFSNLPELSYVDLSDNSLQTLPDDLFLNSPKINELTIGKTQLTRETVNKIGEGRLSSSISILKLDGTPISTLKENMFGGLPQLERLNVQKCQINYIGADILKGTKVANVGLSDNPIISIDNNAFRGAPVSTFECSNCQLTSDKLGFLKNMDASKLLTVRLPNNQLTTIRKDDFSGFPNLQEISLRNNSIETIEKDAFGAECKKSSTCLNVCENPLKCDCNLLWLKQFSEKTTIHNLACFKCSTPANLNGKSIKDLSQSQFSDCDGGGNNNGTTLPPEGTTLPPEGTTLSPEGTTPKNTASYDLTSGHHVIVVVALLCAFPRL